MANKSFTDLLARNENSPPRRVRPGTTSTNRQLAPPHRLFQRPSPISADRSPYAELMASQSSLKVKIKGMPEGWTTWEIYEFFSKYGTVARIEIFDNHYRDSDDAYVIFRPPPVSTEWIQQGLPLRKKDGTMRRIQFRIEMPRPPPRRPTHVRQLSDSSSGSRDESPQTKSEMPERVTVSLSGLQVGVMVSAKEMASLFTNVSQPLSLEINTKFKRLDVHFELSGRRFKVGLDFTLINSARKLPLKDGGMALVLDMAMPPMLFRQTDDMHKTHEGCDGVWNDSQSWYRQTGIGGDVHRDKSVTQLRREGMVLDVGRWLTYSLVFSPEDITTIGYHALGQILTDNNIFKTDESAIVITSGLQVSDLWRWANHHDSTTSDLAAMSSTALTFEVRYQLDACISSGAIHECSVTHDFTTKLGSIDPPRACKILEKVAESKQRYFNPMDIFRLQSQVSVLKKNPPVYCAMIRAAVVTPTTVYFTAPVLETSNRVIRDYKNLEDHFLRVKFTDERYKGKIMSSNDNVMNEVFTRVSRTMKNGIRIGDRHYEFLAFGNSQFRENGAYFFAASGDVTAAHIREKMGDFRKYRDVDRNVAKYASRLGQCFSTTRGMSIRVNIEKLDDIERNGFCFTDGVGKISPFLAQMIAQELGLPNAANDYPSVFQFRLAGCKGVLAVDPSLRGPVVQIRPSQEKWPATGYHGVEICRWSQFTSAYLNVQIILVLNALGVHDNIFVRKMREAVDDVAEALKSEVKALELLSRNIDYNRMTLTLVDMIYDGFMAANDPFFTTCMKLWRSWSIKQLKEKARIPVPDGAFVFGCIDETGILLGHSDGEGHAPGDAYGGALPEVFIQIEEIDAKGRTGRYKVMEGICTLARNPSLHPGDIRTVRAVNVPALHHLKNCVVLPQRGDRDLANMCSGGDLDGDDYLVMWDKHLLPSEDLLNHPPMDYEAPPPVQATKPVSVNDIIRFFVQHIKNDAVGRIATAHKVWADDRDSPAGIKDPKCIELAHSHSTAVDYVKTGVPAKLPRRLQIKQYPHWMERKGKSYYSKKILGKLYDEVQRVPFFADWDRAFDERILNAYPRDEKLMNAALETKQVYDEAVRRVMSQYSIQTEFGVWTTFVLQHSNEDNDYKFAEKLGETVMALKQYHQELCYEKAGTSKQERDWSKLGPFIAAMYTVTAEGIKTAVAATQQTILRAGQHVPVKQLSFASMPLMSFPWLFPRELGNIAKGRKPGTGNLHSSMSSVRPAPQKKKVPNFMDGDELPPLAEVTIAEGTIHEGDILALHPETKPPVSSHPTSMRDAMETTGASHGSKVEMKALEDIMAMPFLSPGLQDEVDTLKVDTPMASSPAKPEIEALEFDPAAEGNEDEGGEEEVRLEANTNPSSLDALSRLMGF